MARKKKSINYDDPVPSRLRICLDEYEKDGKTAAALARYIGIMPQSVSGWRNAENLPDFDNLVKIAEFFDVSTDWLLGRVPIDNKSSNPDVKAMAAYTGLSSDAIERLAFIQTDSNNVIAQNGRLYERSILPLLSWIIAHDHEHIAIEKDEGSTFLHELNNFFLASPGKNFSLIDFKSIDENGDPLVYGEFSEGIYVSQGRSGTELTSEKLEYAILFTIYDRLKELRRAYRNAVRE